jgi:hypothetical protein
VDGGYKFKGRSFAFEGGEKLKSFIDVWQNEKYYRYDASMVYPSAIVLNDEQSSNFAVFSPMFQTYMNDIVPQSLTAQKRFRWGSYVPEDERKRPE